MVDMVQRVSTICDSGAFDSFSNIKPNWPRNWHQLMESRKPQIEKRDFKELFAGTLFKVIS